MERPWNRPNLRSSFQFSIPEHSLNFLTLRVVLIQGRCLSGLSRQDTVNRTVTLKGQKRSWEGKFWEGKDMFCSLLRHQYLEYHLAQGRHSISSY